MKRKIIVGSLFTILILIVLVLINLNDVAERNVLKTEPKFYVKAENLIHNFTIERATMDSLLVEDIIGVEGVVKEISSLNNKQTIFLADSNGGTVSVLCDMQNNQINRIQSLESGDTIRVKGIFKGFLKDVILLNCIITNKNE